MLKNIKNHKLCLLILLAAAIFYSLISVIPHINFQTNAFDLGIFNQAIQKYANFSFGPNTIREVPTLIADHFELLLFIFSPLYHLFGSYTLLIIQIIFALFGGLGCYLLIHKETKNKFLAVSSLIIFLIFFGLITALAFDYHNNTIGAMFIPWLFYTIKLRKIKLYYLILALFLFSKETMPLIAIFFGIGAILFEKKEMKIHGIITTIISVIYFFASLKIIAYFNNGTYDHWPYASLGNSPIEMLQTITYHPLQSLGMMFDNTVKIKMWILLLMSGGILTIFQPKYLILMIPIIAGKFFSSEEVYWGFSHHYAVEFAPIIAVSSILTIDKFLKSNFKKISAIVVIILNIVILSQIHLYNGGKISRIFDINYYKNPIKKDISSALKIIEKADSVSAQNTFIPHLTNDKIYLFPKINDSKYIILNINDKNIWPFKSQKELIEEIGKTEQNNNYQNIYESNGIKVLERRT
ncbi:hypothetical protein A3B60_03175 [Candidatus Peregrinibacteria bacterium RIFCSPLOWO2_01_FULL_39_12]|nr:MAG: hypothetical protein A3B60_03175 [Candidatus Peregrinibacteria bacterium RIFCSPLOWO2_01_FULL_39_12]